MMKLLTFALLFGVGAAITSHRLRAGHSNVVTLTRKSGEEKWGLTFSQCHDACNSRVYSNPGKIFIVSINGRWGAGKDKPDGLASRSDMGLEANPQGDPRSTSQRINKDDVFRIMKINDDDDCSPDHVKEVMRLPSTLKVKLVVEPWPSLIRQGVDAEGRYVEGRYASKQDMCHKEVCEAKTTYTSGGSVVHSTTTSGQQTPILVIRDPPLDDDVKKVRDRSIR